MECPNCGDEYSECNHVCFNCGFSFDFPRDADEEELAKEYGYGDDE